MNEITVSPALSETLAKPPRARLRLANSLKFGLFLLAFILGVVIFAPALTPHNPIAQDVDNRFAPPSPAHPLGTDNFGRDLFSRVIYGGRVDMMIAFISTLLSLLVGLLIGLFSGYFEGWIDNIFSGLINLTLAFPVFVLVISVMAMLGPGLKNMFIAILVISWVSYARMVRGDVLLAKNMEYVDAARALGCGNLRIIFHHILPNIIINPLVYAASDAVLNMIFAGTLGYLGLGIEPPNPEWGAMVAESRTFIVTNPSLVLIPSAAIVLSGIAFSLIGDGLADLIRKK